MSYEGNGPYRPSTELQSALLELARRQGASPTVAEVESMIREMRRRRGATFASASEADTALRQALDEYRRDRGEFGERAYLFWRVTPEPLVYIGYGTGVYHSIACPRYKSTPLSHGSAIPISEAKARGIRACKICHGSGRMWIGTTR